MAEEKILEGEVLNDAELDEVAGGLTSEVIDDRKRLINLGYYEYKHKPGIASYIIVENGFSKLGKALGIDINVKASTGIVTHNKYYLDGKEISRDELWSIIDETHNANK